MMEQHVSSSEIPTEDTHASPSESLLLATASQLVFLTTLHDAQNKVQVKIENRTENQSRNTAIIKTLGVLFSTYSST